METTWSLGLFGSAYGAFLAISFAASRRRWTTADAFFLLFLLNTVATAMVIAFSHRGDSAEWLESAERVLVFLQGPFLYLFTRAAANTGNGVRRGNALHFVPAAVAAIVCASFGAAAVSLKLVIAHQITYTAASFRAYRGRDDRTPQPWTLVLLLLTSLVHIGSIARLISPSTAQLRDIVPLLIGVAFVTLGTIGWHRSQRMLGGAPEKYRKTGLPQGDASRIAARAVELLRDEKLYRNPRLSLAELAAALGVTPHHLSQALNEAGQTTFNDLVAGHRIEDAARRLADPESDRVTIEAIALDAGFPSRSSFYDAFRRAKGVTPSEWKKSERAKTAS